MSAKRDLEFNWPEAVKSEQEQHKKHPLNPISLKFDVSNIRGPVLQSHPIEAVLSAPGSLQTPNAIKTGRHTTQW